MVKYLVIYEKNSQGHYTAYVPDLPGCTSYGDKLTDAKANAKEAIELYLEELREEGIPIPLSSTSADICEIKV